MTARKFSAARSSVFAVGAAAAIYVMAVNGLIGGGHDVEDNTDPNDGKAKSRVPTIRSRLSHDIRVPSLEDMDQMMKKLTLGLVLASSAVLAACRGDGGTAILANNGSVGFVRFVNAIPDSGAQDWRFVDQVEGSPTTFNMAFRGVYPGASYQQASSGQRHLRVFQSSFDQSYNDPTLASPAITSTVFIDTVFTIAEGKHYTLAVVGSLKAKTAKLLILTDDYTDPGSSVAVRVVNLVPAAIDAYASASGGTSALPAPSSATSPPTPRRRGCRWGRGAWRFAPTTVEPPRCPRWSTPPLRPAWPRTR